MVAGYVDFSAILQAELLGIFHGLRLAGDEGVSRLFCFSDSAEDLALLREPPSRFHFHEAIKEMADREWELISSQSKAWAVVRWGRFRRRGDVSKPCSCWAFF